MEAGSTSENEKDPAFEVHMFWDLEDTRVRPNQVSGLVKNIEASLQTVDTRYYLADKKVAVGSSNLDFFLEDEGFYLVDAPKPQRECQDCGETFHQREGVTQPRVIDEMMGHALQNKLQNGLSRNILLVSGSSDFILSLGYLKSAAYNVFLAVLKDSEERYKRCGKYVWDWDMMKEGAAETILRNP